MKGSWCDWFVIHRWGSEALPNGTVQHRWFDKPCGTGAGYICRGACPSLTRAPTKSPIVQPTVSPTKSPIVQLIVQPTKSPIVQPTVSPTEQPTMSPTFAPTLQPTEQPTFNDTNDDVTNAPTPVDLDQPDNETETNSTTPPTDTDPTTDKPVDEREEESTILGLSMVQFGTAAGSICIALLVGGYLLKTGLLSGKPKTKNKAEKTASLPSNIYPVSQDELYEMQPPEHQFPDF